MKNNKKLFLIAAGIIFFAGINLFAGIVRVATGIHKAAQEGNLKKVQDFIKQGVKIDQKDVYDRTPLHWAAEWGRLPVVRFLVKNKANVNAKDEDGQVPIHIATLQGDLPIIKFLVEKEANVNLQSNGGNTPLHSAVNIGHLVGSLEKIKFEIIKLLVGKGAKVNQTNDFGQTPLYRAASGWHLLIVEFLVKKGADVNLQDTWGNTPLHSSLPNLQIMKFLIKNGANVNAKNKEGATPLHKVAYGDVPKAPEAPPEESVKFLVENGAKLSIEDKNGFTPLDVLIMRKERGERGLLDELKYLAHIKYKNGNTQLHIAAKEDYLPWVEFLVDTLTKAGKSEDIDKKNNFGNTPLHIAALEGHLPVVSFLIKHGAKLYTKNNKGQTPLGIAKRYGKNEVVRYLENEKVTRQNILKKLKTGSKKDFEESKYWTNECPICSEEFKDSDAFTNYYGKNIGPITELPCRHIFHTDCILNWLRTPVIKTVPLQDEQGNIVFSEEFNEEGEPIPIYVKEETGKYKKTCPLCRKEVKNLD